MNVTRATYAGAAALALLTTGALGLALARDDGAPAGGASPTSTARVVQLGAPGKPNRTLSPNAATPPSMVHTPCASSCLHGGDGGPPRAGPRDDGPDPHQQPASAELALMADRMDISQRDEIVTMQRWLAQSAKASGAPTAVGGGHGGHGGTTASSADPHPTGSGAHTMPGMLTDPELAQLGAARDAEFDRLFLNYMIRHHEGAISMVEELLSGGEGGQASDVFLLAQHMSSDQGLEIARMKSMLAKG